MEIIAELNQNSKIRFILTATGEESIICISNNYINLMLGRIYFIPINSNINTDDSFYTIKTISKVSDRIDVRYIKNKVACVIPIQHNVKINNQQILCQIVSSSDIKY